MTRLAVWTKGVAEEALSDLLPHVISEAGDNRPMAQKAVPGRCVMLVTVR